MIEPAALADAVVWVNGRMRSHGGGIELVEATDDGAVEVRFIGMCCGCPWKPLTWFGTVEAALRAVPGVVSVAAAGTRISDEAQSRLRATLTALRQGA